MSIPPVIEMDNAGVRRGATGPLALGGVNWRVVAGDFWVVAGSHGGGKSVLLETIAGMLPCAQGELRVFGESLGLDRHRLAALRHRLGLVFEGGGRVFSQLTVGENIALPVGYHTDCPAAEALEQTAPIRAALALDRLAAAPAGRIGRAWAQRVALGRALALAPEVLLLDNPLAGMDPSHVRWWRTFLGELATGHPVLGGRPVTLIATTDDLRPWLQVGRQFALTHERRWQLLGGRAEVAASADASLRDWLKED
jgi:ABC-type transporter Mla maintaining outer membrane lipid asymmetry ATPase subunit MlaF